MKGKITILTFLGFIIFFAIEARAADWKFIFTDREDRLWFYDNQSILRGQDTIKVWVKIINSDETGKDRIENNSFIYYRWEINCSKNIYRILSFLEYSSKGDVTNKKDTPYAQFEEVPLQSVGARLVESICKGK